MPAGSPGSLALQAVTFLYHPIASEKVGSADSKSFVLSIC